MTQYPSGLWVPDGEVWLAVSERAQRTAARQYATMLPPERRRLVVQAGGNVGIFPQELAKTFARVITAEPDPKNFACLARNTEKMSNIGRFELALGTTGGKTEIVHVADNCGRSHISANLSANSGDAPATVWPIDDFELDECDLIQLDVEGYEMHVIYGALETIDRLRPVIVLELNACAARYGESVEEVRLAVEILGYTSRKGHGEDVIFDPLP